MLTDNISENIIFYSNDNEKIINLIKIAEDLAALGCDIHYIRMERFKVFPKTGNYKYDIYRRIKFCYIPTFELLLSYIKNLYSVINLPNVIIVESLDAYYKSSTNLINLMKFLAVLHNLINYLACKTNFLCKSVIHIDKSNYEINYIDKIENLYYFKKKCIFEINK